MGKRTYQQKACDALRRYFWPEIGRHIGYRLIRVIAGLQAELEGSRICKGEGRASKHLSSSDNRDLWNASSSVCKSKHNITPLLSIGSPPAQRRWQCRVCKTTEEQKSKHARASQVCDSA